MTDTNLGRVPALHGAPGALMALGPLLSGLTDGRRVSLMVDPALAASGAAAEAAAGLSAAGFEPEVLTPPPGEPRETVVVELIGRIASHRSDCVVCVGGGSTMDAGKLAAALAGTPGEVSSYRLAAVPLPRRRLPLVCAPTTAGTGSEATAVSVLTGTDGTKYWFWGDALKPDLIVHDPVVTAGLPGAITAATGVDALVHAIEAATNANATPLNSMFALRAIGLVRVWLPAVIRDPRDLEGRARLLEAATLAGIAIDNAGTAIAHNIGHSLGSIAGIPHGRAVAIGMAATLAWNVEHDPDIHAPVATAMGLRHPRELGPAFLEFASGVGVDLHVHGVDAASLARQMAQPENAAMLRSNRRACTADDLAKHAQAALSLTC